MDLARGLCILLVIVLHASSALGEFAAIPSPPAIEAFNAAMGPFRMTLLMFLSGMLLGKSLERPAGTYISGKFAQIYWPFLIWSMVVLLAEGRFTLEYVLKTPISAPSLLWYLWFLFAYYLMVLGMKRFALPILPVVVASLVASHFLPDFLRASRFAYLFVFFLLGHYCTQNRITFARNPALAWGGLALAVLGAWLSIEGVKIRYESLHAWAPLGLIAWVLWLSQFHLGGPVSARIEWVGRNSIVFYVVHFPVQCVVTRLLTSGGYAQFWPLYLAAMATSLAVAILIQLLRQRFDLVAGLFDFRKLRQAFSPSRPRTTAAAATAAATAAEGALASKSRN